jgi:hypothetical protein
LLHCTTRRRDRRQPNRPRRTCSPDTTKAHSAERSDHERPAPPMWNPSLGKLVPDDDRQTRARCPCATSCWRLCRPTTFNGCGRPSMSCPSTSTRSCIGPANESNTCTFRGRRTRALRLNGASGDGRLLPPAGRRLSP